MHVKAAMLLSRVKVFNSRYKLKRHLGDPDMQPSPTGLPHIPRADVIASSPGFIELDRLIYSYLNSFPPHMKDVVINGVIDVSLLTAKSSAHLYVVAAGNHASCLILNLSVAAL